MGCLGILGWQQAQTAWYNLCDSSQPLGLVEIKIPHSAQHMTLIEACGSSTFCLEQQERDRQAEATSQLLLPNTVSTVLHWQRVVWLCSDDRQIPTHRTDLQGQDMVGATATKAQKILLVTLLASCTLLDCVGSRVWQVHRETAYVSLHCYCVTVRVMQLLIT